MNINKNWNIIFIIINEKWINKMKYISCKHLEHGISFFSSEITCCCISSHEGGGQVSCIKEYFGEPVDWDKFFEQRRKIRNLHKSGEIYHRCKGCYYLEERDWDDEDYFNEMLIGHWTHCNCNCIYCYTDKDKYYFNTREFYKVGPVIKDMLDKNLIRNGGEITFGGGEPTILEEFDDLLEAFLSHEINNIRIHSSGIKYSPAIYKGLSEKKVTLIISIDSSTPETYKKIKNVNTFEKVRENIEKYAQANGALYVKYVLMPGFNDTLEEIQGWLEHCQKVGVKRIAFDIEDNWFKANRGNIPQHVYDLFDYVVKNHSYYNLDEYQLYERAMNLREDRTKRLDVY